MAALRPVPTGAIAPPTGASLALTTLLRRSGARSSRGGIAPRVLAGRILRRTTRTTIMARAALAASVNTLATVRASWHVHTPVSRPTGGRRRIDRRAELRHLVEL